MSDPLSIIASVVGLITTSASIAKKLYGSGEDAPTSIGRISEEMDHLHLIFAGANAVGRPCTEKTQQKPIEHGALTSSNDHSERLCLGLFESG